MEKDRKTRFIFAGVILLALIACGVIGYLNRSGVNPSEQSETQTASASISELTYCTGSASLCVTSFGMDNTTNMLIVLTYSASPAVDIYARIPQDGNENIYPCQKIKFSPDTYYCTGSPVADGSTVTLQVYTKADNVLLASGELPVEFGATPAVVVTKTPTATVAVTAAVTATASATTLPTSVGASPTPGRATPTPPTGYPNPTAYPNGTNNSRSYP